MASQEEDDEQYRLVLLTLEEAKLMHLKSIFKDNCLEDETLILMNSEEELRDFLIKEITPNLRSGHAFKFSRHWFNARRKDDSLRSSKQLPSICQTPQAATISALRTAGNRQPEVSRPGMIQSNIGKDDNDPVTSSERKNELVVAKNESDGAETLCELELCTPRLQEETKSFQPNLQLPGNAFVLGPKPDHSTTHLEGGSLGSGRCAEKIAASAEDTLKDLAEEPQDLSACKLNSDGAPEANIEDKKVEKSTSEVKTDGVADTPTSAVDKCEQTSSPSQNVESEPRSETLSTTADNLGDSTSDDISSSVREVKQDNVQLELSTKEMALAMTSVSLPRTNAVNAENANPNPPVQREITDIKRKPPSAQDDAGKGFNQSTNLKASHGLTAFHGVARTSNSEDSEDATNVKYSLNEKPGTENQGKDGIESVKSCFGPKKHSQEHLKDSKDSHSSITTSQKQAPENLPDESKQGQDCGLIEESKTESRTTESPNTLTLSTEQQSKQKSTSDSERTKESEKSAASIKASEATNSASTEEPMAAQLKDEQSVTSSYKPYSFRSILDADESRVVEFKSFAGEIKSRLPWKIMEKSKKFICGCLNSAECKQGILYFGVGEGQGSQYKYGEVHGLDVESLMEKIGEAFQVLLDEHLYRGDGGPIQRAGAQQCIRLKFVPVTSNDGQTTMYVVKLEVSREWNFCKDIIFCCKRWTGKSLSKSKQIDPTKATLGDFYKVATDKFEFVVHTNGSFHIIKESENQRKLKELLTTKYEEWKFQNNSENDSSGAISSQPKTTRTEDYSGEEDSPLVAKTNNPVETAEVPLDSASQSADENANKSEDDRNETWIAGSTDELLRPKMLSGDGLSSCTITERLENPTKLVFEGTDANRTGKLELDDKDKVSKCKPRPFASKERDTRYCLGSILDAEENREVEFKSFAGEHKGRLPWKMMEKAKKFICGCLNSSKQGVIYFGIEDGQGSGYKRGEVRGLDVESSIDDISKAFQAMLDDHLWSDDGLKMQKGGDQQCVGLAFVPVTSTDDQTSLYVVEIEVSRDWNLCADKIYYSKQWKEKRSAKCEQEDDAKMSRRLEDCYKVDKDDVDDAVIRTNAASRSVKKLEVQKQIKQPLTSKYKEWKRQNKSGLLDVPAVPQLDETDTQKFSGVLKDRLHQLNHKEFKYILIANKLPSEYRGTSQLSFLQNIPWTAVFDLFDPCSKKDGLHYVCNETTDAPRAINMSLQDFKEVASKLASGKVTPLSTRNTTWISCDEAINEKEWFESYKDSLYHALSAYKAQTPWGRLICVFLGLSENSISEMADIIESCFSILGESASKCMTIISQNRAVSESLVAAAKSALRDVFRACSIAGIPWWLLKENVKEMVGPIKFNDRLAMTELPFLTGKLAEVLNKTIHSWNDLEVYFPNPKQLSLRSFKDIQKAKDTFYQGGQIEQLNLFHDHDIRRTLKEEVSKRIDDALKAVKQRILCVETVTVPYEAGSGATTLCRRILWEKREEYRCAVVKALTNATAFQIEQYQRIAYDDNTASRAPPVLLLVDNFPESEMTRLCDKLKRGQTKCVILATFPIYKSNEIQEFPITPLRQLDATERARVKDKLTNITKDQERLKGAEKVLEREKRFIWFGLELFGRSYFKIKEKLKNHIESIMTQNFTDGSEDIFKTILHLCCFLHYYSDSRTIFPHPIVIDYLYNLTEDKDKVCRMKMDEIHDRFGGLLVEEFNELRGYYGWRPAHALVGEVVKMQTNLEETAQLLLEKMLKCHSYTKKYLAEDTVSVFLNRKSISKSSTVQRMGADEDFVSDMEFDALGFSEVRMRYSLMIKDTLLAGDGGTEAALKLLISLCEKDIEIEDKAYSLQQLARFIGYEYGVLGIDMKNKPVFKRMHTVLKSMKKENQKLSMPRTAIEAAHSAIDAAIEYQKSSSHHYVTKGHLYLLELRGKFKDSTTGLDKHVLANCIKLCQQAFLAYSEGEKNARIMQHKYHPVIGKIEVIISFFEIVRRLPCFTQESRFARYLNKEEPAPQAMKELLSQDDSDYIQNLRGFAIDLLNQVFGDVKLQRTATWDKKEIQALNDEDTRVLKLRRKFYEVTGLGRSSFSKMSVDQLPSNVEAPMMYGQVVEDVLFEKGETPYSSWLSMSPNDVSQMYDLVKGHCHKGHASNITMLICCKACLRLKEKPPVDELTTIAQRWLQLHPDSIWAHLFNYMLHFPSPNASLATTNTTVVDSCKTCARLVHERSGRDSRKSGAEYFLGRQKGLHAFVSFTELPRREKGETDTDFWRRHEISVKLERVCGQKDVNSKGVVVYRGIRIRFDDYRYPKESRDELWFYLGFTVAGPYAYDPVDQDTYSDMEKRRREVELQSEPILRPMCSTKRLEGYKCCKSQTQLEETRNLPVEPARGTSSSSKANPVPRQKEYQRKALRALKPSDSHKHSRAKTKSKKALLSLAQTSDKTPKAAKVPPSASPGASSSPTSISYAKIAGKSISKDSSPEHMVEAPKEEEKKYRPFFVDRKGKIHY